MGSAMYAVRGRGSRVVGAALAAALLCAAAGCSSGDGGRTAAHDKPKTAERQAAPEAVVKAAVAKSQELNSFTYRTTGTMPDAGEVSSRASLSLRPEVMTLKASTKNTGGKDVGVRSDDGSFYLTGGSARLMGLKAGQWVKLSADDRKLAAAVDADITAVYTRNPAWESGFMAAVARPREAGTRTIDGVKTTHYRGRATVDQIDAQARTEDRQTRERRLGALKGYRSGMKIRTLTMDTYVDAEGRTKRFRMTGEASGGTLDLTTTFSDEGKPVTVEKPPAGKTVSLAKLMKGMEIDLGEAGKNVDLGKLAKEPPTLP
ncbi:hypothetical protein [Streptomyces tsukubensis]|uniref:Lipoprotein n=1 Tax=Streptomyces tsukubensis TaxID=83656 RepID=A0A1V4A7T6_9ACTN|nr:hypothetical protein [Streptomyces tsukubensis]OON78461.1 hypothetical protein B1H18_16990 [Streptomyces tsukubensis]QFR95225.1 DUF1396 domain-containing protein [Streptomyces tsukubensis]